MFTKSEKTYREKSFDASRCPQHLTTTTTVPKCSSAEFRLYYYVDCQNPPHLPNASKEAETCAWQHLLRLHLHIRHRQGTRSTSLLCSLFSMSMTKFSATHLHAWRFPKRNEFFTIPVILLHPARDKSSWPPPCRERPRTIPFFRAARHVVVKQSTLRP